ETLTHKLLFDYLKIVRCDDDSHTMPTFKDVYQYVVPSQNIKLGKANPPMVQNIFDNEEHAKMFLDWIKSLEILKPYEIKKARVTNEQGKFVVRLDGLMYDAILGDGEYDKLRRGIVAPLVSAPAAAAAAAATSIEEDFSEL